MVLKVLPSNLPRKVADVDPLALALRRAMVRLLISALLLLLARLALLLLLLLLLVVVAVVVAVAVVVVAVAVVVSLEVVLDRGVVLPVLSNVNLPARELSIGHRLNSRLSALGTLEFNNSAALGAPVSAD